MAVVSDYRCNQCDLVFEAELETETYPPCPSCGGGTRRIFSIGGITFRGSGFYRNDSKN